MRLEFATLVFLHESLLESKNRLPDRFVLHYPIALLRAKPSCRIRMFPHIKLFVEPPSNPLPRPLSDPNHFEILSSGFIGPFHCILH